VIGGVLAAGALVGTIAGTGALSRDPNARPTGVASAGGPSSGAVAQASPDTKPSAAARASREPLGSGVLGIVATSDRWVAPTGSDTADGSQARPWKTIQRAVDLTPAGGVITVRGGTYSSFVIRRSGLTVQGAAGEVATVSGGNYVVQVKGVSSATVRGLTIANAPNQWGSGVRVETSQNVLIEKNLIRDNKSFGIKVKDASKVRIVNNEIRKNDTGIELSGAVAGTVVTANRIHHNDRMVTSSRGGNGIVFAKTTGLVTVSYNRLWGNRARHLTDSGYDGGAFEVYGASDLKIVANELWDNNNIMETGTDGSVGCSRITFARNVAYNAGTVPGETQGLILRCAASSLFANNTFDGIDTFAFYISRSGSYAGSIANLRIENNVVAHGRAYSLGSSLPSGLVIDHGLVQPGGAALYAKYVAYVQGRGNTTSLAEFRAWTGHERHGAQGDPRFVDAAKRNYRLQTGSPAIDRGVLVLGGAFNGAAPDLGRFEWPG
jgi:parallel beta-helix repeat protein